MLFSGALRAVSRGLRTRAASALAALPTQQPLARSFRTSAALLAGQGTHIVRSRAARPRRAAIPPRAGAFR
jgi:hypothetical protein